MAKKVSTPPCAGNIMGSMRSMGYTFEEAIADIIDNSISAKAKNISLHFPKRADDPMQVVIEDDGIGMSREELIEAMRYGTFSHESERRADDLGRYGLGLKSASLSQCTKLIVISKKNNQINAFCWDYEEVKASQKWNLLEYTEREVNTIGWKTLLEEKACGTLVIWDNIDKLRSSYDGNIFTALTDYAGKLVDYLSLVFHKFMGKIKFKINECKVPHINPYLNEQTLREDQKLVTGTRSSDLVPVKVHVLPFIKQLTPANKKTLGITADLNKYQGIYIYRNKRLILHDWFGLAKKCPNNRYIRISIDIKNNTDALWGLDIKKKRATLPENIKKQLKRLVERYQEVSDRIEKKRTRVASQGNYSYIWNRTEVQDGTTYYKYTINRDLQLVNAIRNELKGHARLLDSLLKNIEDCLPIRDLLYDDSKDQVFVKELKSEDLEIWKQAVVDNVKVLQLAYPDKDVKYLIDEILNTEPYYKVDGLQEVIYKEFEL